MNDKEISEIRRRYRAEKSGISRIRGCYVNEKRTIISEFDQSLGLMSESEAEEVLTLLRKALSGKVGTNLMDIAFSTAQVQSGAEHGLLMTLRESALGDDAAVHAFYEKVIGSLALEGNYMILLCHDSYDVFSYHKDGGRSEDSGEIFRYILCAICPVSMAKPALSYFVRDNCFRNITADSVVAPPALGFLFPAFDNRSTNLYGALYYTRDTSDSHEEFTDAVFRAGKLPMPAAAQQETFRNVLAESVGEACSLPVVRAVRAQICQAVEDHKASKEPEPLTVTPWPGGEIPFLTPFLYDLDGDGQDELIFHLATAAVASQTENVYRYDPETGALAEELIEYPAVTYYANGYAVAQWSHNQGLSDDDFWPYNLYAYSADTQTYELIASVDAWAKARSLQHWEFDFPYPDQIDAEGAGSVYLVTPRGGGTDVLSQTDYHAWLAAFDLTEPIAVAYLPLTAENIAAVGN